MKLAQENEELKAMTDRLEAAERRETCNEGAEDHGGTVIIAVISRSAIIM
jgi:hypothetical protein